MYFSTGFKQTDEPSYEQLAVLQSSNSYKDKHHRSGATNNPKQQSNKNSAASSAATSAKPKTNGHLPSNGTVKKAAPAPAPSTSSAGGKTEGHKNNENKPPVVQAAKKSVKDPANKPEDFESGKEHILLSNIPWVRFLSLSRETGAKKGPGGIFLTVPGFRPLQLRCITNRTHAVFHILMYYVTHNLCKSLHDF